MEHSFHPFVRYAAKVRHFLPRISVARDCRLLFILSGRGSFESEGEVYSLKENTLVYYPCGTSYRIRSDPKDRLLFYTVNFDFTQDFSHLTDTLYPVPEKSFASKETLRSYEGFDTVFSKIQHISNALFAAPLLQSIYDEHTNRQCGFHEIQEAQMAILLLLFSRSLHTESVQNPICTQIHSLVAEDLSRNNEAIAELLGYHPYYLNSFFKKREGITLHQYILQQRLSRAYEQITTTDLPIGEIALSCGFSSQPYFSNLFQKRYHIRPMQLRQQI